MQNIMNEDGQGMVEYALIIALVVIAAVAGFTLLGKNSASKVNQAANSLSTATN